MKNTVRDTVVSSVTVIEAHPVPNNKCILAYLKVRVNYGKLHHIVNMILKVVI